ncbi:hypothetical protein ACFOTA_10060 [Chitinophaga sp. GCM10012297]|uniref:Uncharacterized protein n=1 Tax=Chitinophaga chungangae TaxID=2821488 RepID=A0ABS3YCZ2_9BACT|nr:hypothetical protein [Chitinophaga chungangae]MBO9152549.1 hypothetical protein [Chitinophaga chungangae]
MHNPLYILDIKILDALILAGYSYFVRQSYPRGMQRDIKESFVITHYRSAAEARTHYETILTDQRRYIYDIRNPAGKEKLYHAATQPGGYRVYIALLKDQEWKPGPMFKAEIKRFMRLHCRLPEGREKGTVVLHMQFGELLLTLPFLKDGSPVPLSQIEKI